ncbi:MAG: hypothetical protein CMJ25_18445 [Phycisphaerae bacterium]|nr:hypothetical protein [Phycisphaerae bacterium]
MAKKKVKKKVVKVKKVSKKPTDKKPIVKKSTIKKATIKKPIKRKPVVKKVIEKPFAKKIEKAFIRYSIEITKFIADKNNILLEVFFDYKGTLVIPKSLKEDIKPGNHIVSGSFMIPEGVKDPVLLKDYNQLTKSEVIGFLKNNIREAYLQHLSQMIEDELFPDVKIIEDLPWK